MQKKLYRITKTIGSEKAEMIADENQLSALRSDPRITIGEEIKSEPKKSKKISSDFAPDPPAELPEKK